MEYRWTYDPDMPIDTIMRRWPATITVVIRHGMLCVGCPIGGFHTVPDACLEHGIDEDSFVRELGAAIDGTWISKEREGAPRKPAGRADSGSSREAHRR